MKDGKPTVCVPNPGAACVAPYHDSNDRNAGGPHGDTAAAADIDGGKMDGFVRQQSAGRKAACAASNDPQCSVGGNNLDVMGYHTDQEIPNYWAYAQKFCIARSDVRIECLLEFTLAFIHGFRMVS